MKDEKFKIKMPKDVEAKVSPPSAKDVEEAVKLVAEAYGIDMDKKRDMGCFKNCNDECIDAEGVRCPHSNCRIDSPNGTLKYFKERFGKFAKERLWQT